MDFLDDIISCIEDSIDDSGNISSSHIWIIKAGYDSIIDEYRNIVEWGHSWITQYQQNIQEKYSSKTLKVKYSSTVGYYIEVPRSFNIDVLWEFQHKQTLTGTHRFTTNLLSDFEERIFNAEERILEREKEIIHKIINNVKLNYNNIDNISENISFFDFLVSGAKYSITHGCTTPIISEKKDFSVSNARHPVLSANEKGFVSNNASFCHKKRVQIITWPNMGWKSTYLRQNALLLLCAHIWYDVTANSMETHIVDKVFSRVGASDNIMLWQSTFMVEMQEIAYIMRSATENSFLIIDEIWRGTSTADWLALAWAILRHIHDIIWSKCIFATHYHELIDLSHSLSATCNLSVAVWENDENIVFLRKLIPGGMKKSYGIEVAKIAGVQKDIINTAKDFQVPSQKFSLQQIPLEIPEMRKEKEFSWEQQSILDTINELDLNTIAPLDLMNKIAEIKQLLKK